MPEKLDKYGKPKEDTAGFDPFRTQPDKTSALSDIIKKYGYTIPSTRRKENESVSEFQSRNSEKSDIVEETLQTIIKGKEFKQAEDKTKRELLEIAGTIKPEDSQVKRLHNIKARILKETLKKPILKELDKYGLDSEEKQIY